MPPKVYIFQRLLNILGLKKHTRLVHNKNGRSSVVGINLFFRGGGIGSIGAAIYLASECTFARLSPCRVRGLGTIDLI